MAMGIATGGFAAGTLAGTVGAGLLVGALGWKAAFLGRLPFCVLAIGLGWLVIKDPAPQERRGSFDVGGAALVVGAIVALVLGLHLGSRQGWTSPLAVASLAAVPALAATYVMSALRARRPAVDLHLLRLPPFLAACSGTFGIYLGAFVIWFIFPFFVAEVLGRGAAALGIMMGLMAAAMSPGSSLGRLALRPHPCPIRGNGRHGHDSPRSALDEWPGRWVEWRGGGAAHGVVWPGAGAFPCLGLRHGS